MSTITTENRANIAAAIAAGKSNKDIAKEFGVTMSDVKTVRAEVQAEANPTAAEINVQEGVTDQDTSALEAMLAEANPTAAEEQTPTQTEGVVEGTESTAVATAEVTEGPASELDAMLADAESNNKPAEQKEAKTRASRSTLRTIKPASSKDSEGKSLQRRNYNEGTRKISVFVSKSAKLAHITTDVNFSNRNSKEAALNMCHQVMGKQKTIMEICQQNDLDWVLLDEEIPFERDGEAAGDFAKAKRLAVQQAFQNAGYRILGRLGTGTAAVPDSLYTHFPELQGSSVAVAPTASTTDTVTEEVA